MAPGAAWTSPPQPPHPQPVSQQSQLFFFILWQSRLKQLSFLHSQQVSQVLQVLHTGAGAQRGGGGAQQPGASHPSQHFFFLCQWFFFWAQQWVARAPQQPPPPQPPPPH